MAIRHAEAGEVVDVRPLGSEFAEQRTHALVKSDSLELIRLVLPQGKELPTHSAPGPITVHCLEGRVAFTTMGKEVELQPGNLLHLPAKEPHAVRAMEDSSVLLTIVFPQS